jgi:hypothetical protein
MNLVIMKEFVVKRHVNVTRMRSYVEHTVDARFTV